MEKTFLCSDPERNTRTSKSRDGPTVKSNRSRNETGSSQGTRNTGTSDRKCPPLMTEAVSTEQKSPPTGPLAEPLFYDGDATPRARVASHFSSLDAGNGENASDNGLINGAKDASLRPSLDIFFY